MSTFCRLNIFLLLLFGNIVYSQISNARINYKVKINLKEQTKPVKKPSQTYQLVLNEVRNLELELLYNVNNSVFREIKSLTIDNKTRVIRNMSKTILGINGDFYCNYVDSVRLMQREFQGEKYLIKSDIEKYSWELTNETKIINKYKCFKAKALKKYKDRNGNINKVVITAWYTPNINIPIGPKDFYGLPGLILELHEGNNETQGITYYATKINLNFEKTVNINIPEGNIISQDVFDKIAEKTYLEFKN